MTALFLAVILGIMSNPTNSTAASAQTPQPRGRVLGIGGVFFKSPRPKDLTSWYEKHLGFQTDPRIGVSFPWKLPDKPDQTYRTVWFVFPKTHRTSSRRNPS